MFLLREVFPEDLAGLTAVAEHLNSVNLPNDPVVLAELIALSRKSFAGQLDVFKRQYLFGLFERTATGERLIGTSMIHAQHGTRRAPHIFFDVLTDERYSESLDRHVVHRILRIGYNYNGPTEIGGLVLLPEYRRHEVALGRWLSYVRFLYMALHRERFRDEVLSELMPPLESDGTSLLWESLGRHFTLMSYQEADRTSQTNKEFIRALFPQEPIYASLLPGAVQEIIGVVGPETKGVEKMLRRIGFEYAERIDPFDGGPHFIARTDDITVVKASRRARLQIAQTGDGADYGLVSVEHDTPPHFAATGSRFRLDARADGATVMLPPETIALLGARTGDEVGVLPFEVHR
jgi:arginine N-succinyltransferase